jgi:hypothetical protein
MAEESSLYQATTFTAGVDTPYQGVDFSVIIYGVMADILMIVPILLYVLITDTNGYA